ncbi:PLP-dependent aminotransferase family protein [Pseudovibrio brasiliensis]|uniref:PLP-dependent aminotransferase family protein n=1 Tax=Pseudovibrio brasiliensis TaxID=1898042 RepID=A0ABX8AU84_9HYPH|nr:PLP-dependent aminotransferase family protein [Pseudovibrio brasiliensis]QUS58275.1 PLP-dependent aminotransferase family protein [Pseudovibrio brasiliensis]
MYANLIRIDRNSTESLQTQIRRQLAIAIVNRQFPAYRPLPSIRKLSKDLGVSVTTVSLAYESLKQDGFVESRDRAGIYIREDALLSSQASDHLYISQSNSSDTDVIKMDFRSHFRGRSFNMPRVVKPSDSLVRFRFPFICGLIDPNLFPIASWRECIRDSVNVVEMRNWATDYSSIDDELLVEQLMQRVLSKRGIIAHPEEILITLGGQQALYLAVKLLLRTGETIGIEDPGYPDILNMAQMENLNVRRLPIDKGGMILSDEINQCKCLYTTPSHQFPTTVTMPVERREELLRITAQNRQFIIEDDYEAEIAFDKTPPPALKSLDRCGNVIYAGSLSKSLMPGLRIGYLVADREFIREAKALRHHILRHPPVNNQRSVALFLQRGYFDRFLAKISNEYKARCKTMHQSLEAHFPGASVLPEFGGGSIWLKLPEDIDAGKLQQKVMESSVYFETGGFTFSNPSENLNHIRLGYSVIDNALITEGIELIAKAALREK